MTDNLPGRSRDEGAGRPLSRVEFEKRNRARKALEMFHSGKSYVQIKNALKLRSVEVAKEQVIEGERLWESEESGALTRYVAGMRDSLWEVHGMLMEVIRDDRNLGAVDRLVKVEGRLTKLIGGDAQREEAATGNTYVLTSGDINMVNVPKGGELVDCRKPWERPENHDIEGEVVE